MSGRYKDDIKPILSRRLSPTLKLGIFLILSVVMLMVDHQSDELKPVRSAFSTVLRPLELIAELPSGLGQVGAYFSTRATLEDENKRLQKEQLLLMARLQRLAALESENMRIRALLQSSKRLTEEVLIAEIQETSNDPYRHYLRLNKGGVDGIYEGQPLIDAHGILGQVVSVSLLNSEAIMITDADHSIPVEINRNGLRTIAQGQGSDRLRLPYLPLNADIREGDLVVSSGLGGRYPAGYPVGTVVEVHRYPGEEFLEVYASPAAHIHHGREVLLVKQPPDVSSSFATNAGPRS